MKEVYMHKEMDINVFVYGTLLNDEILSVLLNQVPVKVHANLSGFKRVKVMGESYPAIYPDQDNQVDGALLVGLKYHDLICLDAFEGSHYKRKTVSVCTKNEVIQNCMTYVFKPEYYKFLSSEPWCNKSFRQKHLKQFLYQLNDEN